MYFSQTQKEKMKLPSFKTPDWKPRSSSNIELTKWIKEFKNLNNL